MKKGFTLIELILVIAIVLTIGILSNVFYGQFLLRNAVSDTTDRVVGALRQAQWYSVTGKNGGRWGVKVSDDSVTVFQGNSYGSRDTSLDRVLPANAHVLLSGSPDEIVFARVTGSLIGSASVSVSGGGIARTVSISEQGVIEK